MVQDAHRRGSLRQRVSAEGFLAQQFARFGDRKITRRRIEFRDGQPIRSFERQRFRRRPGHLLRVRRAGREHQQSESR